MKTNYSDNNQDGMALVITLILLLTLTILASSVFMSVNRYAETIDNISYRPQAMEAANSCVDQALDWLATSDGVNWMSGDTPTVDLAFEGNLLNKKTVLEDTTMPGDTKGDMFLAMLEKSSCTKVLITKVLTEPIAEGEEIGSKINYVSDESTAFKTVVKIEARGVFNVPLNSSGTAIKFDNWNSTSNIVDIEVYVELTPF
jgi:Tfp pilus assembly protein PilX